MRANKSKWTKQEVTFASLACGWERGRKAEYNADFIWRKAKVAVFLDGDFWHGRKGTEGLSDYWKVKIGRTEERDRCNRSSLEADGWLVLQILESEFKKDPQAFVDCVQTEINRRTGGGHYTVRE